jgi:hypothetical protein
MIVLRLEKLKNKVKNNIYRIDYLKEHVGNMFFFDLKGKIL